VTLDDIWADTVTRYADRPHKFSRLTFALDTDAQLALFTGTCAAAKCIHQSGSSGFTEQLTERQVRARMENAILVLESQHRGVTLVKETNSGRTSS
jgi:hypothetical protein